MRVAPLRVWKCLKVPEGTWKCHKVKWTVLYLHSPCTVENSPKHTCCLPKIKYSMGISIEQYWSRIGSHGNFVKTKDILSRFWSVIIMMFRRFKCMPVLKQFVGQYKNVEWCDVLVFTNDFLQATRAICANYSQENQVLFGENAGKQCVTMSLTAVIYHHQEDINFWTSSTLNNILTIGNNLYMYISV